MTHVYLIVVPMENNIYYATDTLDKGISLANLLCTTEQLEPMIDVFLLCVPYDVKLDGGLFSTESMMATMVDFT